MSIYYVSDNGIRPGDIAMSYEDKALLLSFLSAKDWVSGAPKGEAAHVLINLGDNDDEGQNGDVLPGHSLTAQQKLLQSPFMQLPNIRVEHELRE